MTQYYEQGSQVPAQRSSQMYSPQAIMPQNSADEMDLMKLLGDVWRGKWIVLACILCAFIATAYYVFEVAVPKYRATTSIVLQVRDQQVVDLDSVISGVGRDRSALNTELEIIKSRAMIERLVLDLDLHEKPEFNGLLRDPSPYSVKSLVKQIRQLITGTTPQERTYSEEDHVRATVNAVTRAISVEGQRDTYVFNISATSGLRSRSIAIANRLAQLYLEEQVNVKFDAIDYAVGWLSGRVNELDEELREKEDAIKMLRQDTQFVGTDALESLTVRVVNARVNLEEVKSEIQRNQDSLEQRTALLEAKDYAGILAATNDPLLRRLMGPDGTVADDRQAAFWARVESEISNIADALSRAEARLEAQQSAYENLVAQRNAQTADFELISNLTNEAESIRVLHETFLARLKETSLQIGLQQADSRILSPAAGALQVAPRVNRSLTLAIVIGALIGGMLVLLRQARDTGIKTPERLQEIAQLPVLGKLPVMPIKSRNQLIPYLVENPTSFGAESVRNLRTSIMMSNVDTPPQMIMVTSAVPGESKTSTAITLAMNYASLGKRTLLVECDMRRRTLDKYFPNLQAVKMVKLLTGEISIRDASTLDETSGVNVLLANQPDANAADLFSSDKFGQLLISMREQYDIILLDTPPVTLVTDARIIAQHCDSVIFAVKWNSTPETVVSDGVDMLKSLDLNISGVVMTMFDQKTMNKYGYGGYGRYGQYGKSYYNT